MAELKFKKCPILTRKFETVLSIIALSPEIIWNKVNNENEIQIDDSETIL